MTSCTTTRRFLLFVFSLITFSAVFGQPDFDFHNIDPNLRGAYWVHAGDINDDGHMDLATAGYDGIVWWEGDGAGNFVRRPLLGSLQGCWASFIADVDGDGRLDILGGSTALPELAWWRNRGNGNFDAKETIDDSTNSPETIAVADFDNDGDGDIAVAMWGAGLLVWYEYKGSDNFERHILDSDVSGAHTVFTGDLNGDGLPDVVGAGSAKTRVYYNTGGGNFSRKTLGSDGSWGSYIYDIDQDGKLDILRTQRTNGDVEWFRNTGSGFSGQTIASAFGESWSVSAGDIDGDGDVDIAAAGFGANNITAWLNNGDNTFSNGVVVDEVAHPRAVFITNIDADADADIAAAIRDDDELNWYNVTETLTLTEPVAGDSVASESDFTIRWVSSGVPAVDLEFSSDGGASWAIVAKGITGTEAYAWSTPDIASQDCRIRVTDASDASPSATSGSFSLFFSKPSLTIIAPNGGEDLEAGSATNIEWVSTGEIDSVKIEFSSDNGAAWNEVISATQNDGVYEWAPPFLVVEQALLRISALVDSSVTDRSDLPFAITAVPVIDSFSPTRGVPGTEVLVFGRQLFDIIGVFFGQELAEYHAIAPDSVRCVVPNNARSATITIGTTHGLVTSDSVFVINLAPIALPDSAFMQEDGAVVIDVTRNDTDSDGSIDPSSVRIELAPSFGETRLDTLTGRIEYRAQPDFFGTDSFGYVVSDIEGRPSAQAIVKIFIEGVNDAPTAVLDSISIRQGETHILKVLANDYDVDDGIDTSRTELLASPRHGEALWDSKVNAFVYQPNPDFSGLDSLIYRIFDVSGEPSQSATVYLFVSDINHAPVIEAFFPDEIEISFAGRDSLLFGVTVSDLDQDELNYTWLLNERPVATSETYLFVVSEHEAMDYIVKVIVTDGELEDSVQWGFSTMVNSVGEGALPESFAVSQNYPNPFNPSTKINFSLPQAGHVSIKVYNLLGREVETLLDANLKAGLHSVTWAATNSTGENICSGVYFYRVLTENHFFIGKMLFIQ